MLNFFYWISGIVVATILTFLTVKFTMNKIKNVKVHQTGKELDNVQGVNLELTDGEDIHLQDTEIVQNAEQMKNVTGLSIKASGKQSARLQGIHIKQPNAEVIISNDPNVKVEINKSF